MFVKVFMSFKKKHLDPFSPNILHVHWYYIWNKNKRNKVFKLEQEGNPRGIFHTELTAAGEKAFKFDEK